MSPITSILGDVWLISDTIAMPEGGDRSFGLNENMVEMIDKAKVSEKWANRLRIIAEAPLNAKRDAIYVPDNTFFNWYRAISLEYPDFRQDDYWSGALVYYPEDTRLFVEEFVAEPGSYYGPYFVCARIDGVAAGMVGYAESRSELPGILERLSGTELHPLPKFSTSHSTVFDLCNGFKAEVYVSKVTVSDIEEADFETVIADADSNVVFKGILNPGELFACKESHDGLQAMIAEKRGEVPSKAEDSELREANERLRLFASTELYAPDTVAALKEKIEGLSDFAPIKLITADGKTELLVSSAIIKEWKDSLGQRVNIPAIPTKSDIRSLGLDSVRLTHRREFSLLAKDASGFWAFEAKFRAGFSIDKLFDFTNDAELLFAAIEELGKRHNEYGASIIDTEAVLSLLDSSDNREFQYLYDRVIPIEALINRARPDVVTEQASSGMSMG